MVHPVVLVNLKSAVMKKAIFISLLCLGGMAAKAQIPQPDPDTTAKHFLIVASIGNLQEESAGRQAVAKAKRANVRAFGEMMVKDHGQSEQQLLALAKRKGYNLPAAATGGIQPDLNLQKAGDNFDKVYVHDMVAGHGNKVQAFEAYTINGKDPDVKAWAQQMLPTIKEHLAHIKMIEKQLAAGK
jgi:putative membrane protein